MKVFISWSGPQSKHIARALRGWLCEVIQNLDPWMSEIDIGAGQQWVSELWNGLEDSYFGVVCLTAENLESPWLHYEAGALAKTVDRRVCPYLYKIESSAVKGPLSQLQMKQADEQGTKELVQSINDTIKVFNEKGLLTNEKSLSPEQLNKAFSRCWPELKEKLSAIPPSTTAPPPRRDIQEMVEEILAIVRSQQARSSGKSNEALLPTFLRASLRDDYIKARDVVLIDNEISELMEQLNSNRISKLTEKFNPNEISELMEKIVRQKSISGKSLPPSDTPQEGKTPSK